MIARTVDDSRGHVLRASGRRALWNEISFRALRKKRKVPPPTARRALRQRAFVTRGRHGDWTVVVCEPLWVTSMATNRTAAGEYETRPPAKVATTVVGRVLRSLVVRRPIEWIETGQPACIAWPTVFQSFVTVALRVTLKDARLAPEAPSAVPVANASRQARTVPLETMK